MNTTETESIRHQAKLAALPFVENRATAESAQTLRDELLYQRATQSSLQLSVFVGASTTAPAVRYTEQYDPNPRCEPIVLYFPFPGIRQPSSPQALSCRWVEDSCVKLSDWEACQRWQVKKKEAASAVLHAFSDTAAYRKSELARANQILNDNCR